MNRSFFKAIIAPVLIISSLTACASQAAGPRIAARLDEEGYLYYMDYVKDYYSPEVMDAMRKIGFIDIETTAF